MNYTELEKLAHELCDNLPENKVEGWNWWNIDGDARIHWLNKAHDQIVSKAKVEALTEAADAMDADPEFRDPLRLKSDWLRTRAQQLTEES